VVSAPAERCVATVRPYAASFGGVIEIEAAFEVPANGGTDAGPANGTKADRSGPDRGAADRGARDRAAGADAARVEAAGSVDRVAAAMARLAADDRPVVVCAHRENLPALLAAACAALGAPNPKRKPLRKCEFAVLHRADGTLAALERYHPDGQSLVVRLGGANGFGLAQAAADSPALRDRPCLRV
jgi:broad specificity phosphatase PhoE